MGLKKREYIYIAVLALFCPIALLAFIYSVADIDIKQLGFSEGHLLSVVGIIVSTVGLIFTVYFVVLAVSARKIQFDIDDTLNKYNELKIQKQEIKEELHRLNIGKDKVGNEIKDEFERLNRAKDKVKNDIENLNETKEKIRTELNDLRSPINNYLSEIKNRKKELDYLLSDYAQSLYESLEVQIGLASSSGKNPSLIKLLTLKRARLSYKYPMLKTSERLKLFGDLGNVGEPLDIVPVQNIINNESEPEEIKKVAFEVVERLNKKWSIE